MHARIDELLSIRDGKPAPAELMSHVFDCPACQTELTQLQARRQLLRALPEFDAPDVWRDVQVGAASTGAGSRVQRWAAAVSLIAIGLVFAVASLRDAPATREEAFAVAAGEQSQITEPQLAALIERSRALESRLQQLPRPRAVQRASTAVTIDGLERRIQWLDYTLTYAHDADLNETQAARLWQERVQLMDTLVKVRYAESSTYSY